jgi:hypothetical protein
MAVNVDTVYQRVLAIANKEQRGYITPQEFNLLANQAQMDIFEQYFYDISQHGRRPGNETEYSNITDLLHEKLMPFQKRHQQITIGTTAGVGTLPTDVYKLGTIVILPDYLDTTTGEKTLNELSEKDYLEINASPLTRPSTKRPVFVRDSATTIRIYPASVAPATFTENAIVNNSTTITLGDFATGNVSKIAPGQIVTGAGIPADTFVVSVNPSSASLTEAVLSNATTGGSATPTLTYAENDIKCNYIKRPTDIDWGYTTINGTALYNSASATNFELHASEETTLVRKILALAGVIIEDPSIYQIASQEDLKNIQQEKQ